MFAIFEDVGFSELLMILIAGVLCFGKRLPEVASQAGVQLAKLRRSLQDIKTESGVDHEVRKIQRTFQDATHDLNVGDMARMASAKMQERMQATRKELCEEIEKPAALPEARAVDPVPPATAPTTETPLSSAPPPAAPDTKSAGPIARGSMDDETPPPAAVGPAA